MRSFCFRSQTEDHLLPNLGQTLGVHLPRKPIVLVPMNPGQTEQLIAESRNGNDVSTLFTNILFGSRPVLHQMGTGEKKICRECLQLFFCGDTPDFIGLRRRNELADGMLLWLALRVRKHK